MSPRCIQGQQRLEDEQFDSFLYEVALISHEAITMIHAADPDQ
jgi:hypothetical protein